MGEGAMGFSGLVSRLERTPVTDLTERYRELELREREIAAEKAAIAHQIEQSRAHRIEGHRSISAWLRANCNHSGATVRRLTRVAALCAADPSVGDELLAGRIGVDQAAELGRAHANPRCGEQIVDFLDVLVDSAESMPFDDFRDVVRRWEVLADVEGAHRDRGAAVQARQVLLAAGANGIDLVATGGTAMQAAEMASILDAFNQREFDADLVGLRERLGAEAPLSGMARTEPQRRFDALLKIFRTAKDAPVDGSPVEVTVDVVVDQHTFESALADHHLADEPGDLLPPGPARARCHTDRGVPLLPDDAVLAALGGWVRRVVVDAQSVTIDRGRASRLFSGSAAAAARLLVTRCEHPGCVVPEHRSQVDHLREWHEDGRTDQTNAGIACGHHNRHKHRHRLRARRDSDGRLHVQRPDGTWIHPVGTDPPTDDDFLTDREIAARVRRRLGLR